MKDGNIIAYNAERMLCDALKNHIDGLNTLIASWHKLLQNTELTPETRLQVITAAIRTYIETQKDTK